MRDEDDDTASPTIGAALLADLIDMRRRYRNDGMRRQGGKDCAGSDISDLGGCEQG